MSRLFIVSVILFSGLFLIMRCSSDPSHESHEQHLLEKIHAHQELIDYKDLISGQLDTSNLVKVYPSDHDIDNFYIEPRSGETLSYPCSNCHDQALAKMISDKSENSKKAHWNVHINHAAIETMNCTTCHAENNMDKFTTLTGTLIDFDESYKLCGQCHSTQLKDWEGGAHGKQNIGWVSPRVSNTCVSCHKPHEPAFPKRFPARFNTNELEE